MAKLRSTDLNGNLFVSGQLKLQNPFLISTDELITNLNADLLDGYHANDIIVKSSHCYDTSTSDKAGTWTISIPGITELTEGLTIKIRLKTSYNSTKNTLNVNGLGAKTVYFKYGNKLTSHYAKESVLALTYTTDAISSGTDRTGWIVENIYDSTNTYQLRKYYSRYTTKSALYRYMICFVNKDNLLIPANNVNNSTATDKTLTTDSFDLTKGIYYYNSTTVAEGGLTGTSTLYQQIGLVNLQYSFNTGTTLTGNKPVYVVVTPTGTNGEVVLASNPIAQTLPTSNDGNRYVFLGYAYDTYRIELTIDHPIYVYNSVKGCYTSEEYSHESSISNLESNKVSKSGDTINGNLTITGNINVSQYNDASGVSLMNNGGGTATQFGSSQRPARMFSSTQPEWWQNGASKGVLALKSDIPSSLKNPHSLTFGSKTYDGSSAQTINASDLGALTSHQDISGKANLSGGNTFSGNQIFTGYLDIRGTAAEKHLKTRGIGGSDGNGNEAELYLQYNSSYPTKFGSSGDGSLNSDGTITEAGKLLSDKYAAKSHTHTKSQITDFSHTHSKSEVGLGNVDNTADANKSVKYATTAGTANSVPEANLTWGGKNFAGGYGPIDAAMVPSLGANRLAFVPAAGVTVEYSRDGGSTWTDYGLNDTQKTALFSGPQTSTGAVIGKPSRNSSTNKYENVSVNNRLRVTLKSDAAHVYTALNKFVIYCSTSGSTGCKCTIQGLTKNNYDAGNNSWTTFADGVDIAGWSGFNVINTSSITTYSNNSSQYIQIRFTFYCGGNSSMETYGGLSIINIYGFGGVGWTTPSNMAKWGQVYSYDAGQNVAFPAAITSGTIYAYNVRPRANNTYTLGANDYRWASAHATTFYENGTALADKYAAKSHTHTKSQIEDFPTIPTVNNPTITINQGGTKKGSFTLNQSGATTIDLTDNNTTYSAGTGLSLSGTTFSVSSANVSTMMNLLSEGTSDPTDNDYYISQYVGGGTTTTTYHRRPVSKLYNYMKGKFDSIYQAKGSYAASGHTHTSLNTAFVFNNSDMPQGSDNLSKTAATHKINFYRNGLSIPYQAEDPNDGGILRCRGSSESSAILELGTWDDSGAGETIQFNYYPTTSQITPTYSVSVPKKTGTIALTSDIPTSLPASDVYAWAKASSKPSYSWSEITSKPSEFTPATHTHTDLVPKNHNGRFYPFIGSAYRKSNYKVTLPISGYTDSNNCWMMITMELILGGSYSSGANGTIFLSYYFLKNSSNYWSADEVRAIGIGNKLADNSVSIQYDISNPGIFYVHSNNSEYNSFSIQNLTANDTAPNFDFTKTTIEAVASIPSGLTKVPLTCVDSKGDNKLYVNNTAVSLDGHTHASVADIYNNKTTTFAYSQDGLGYDSYTWLAGWNGYELRAVNKSQFAKASHSHDYLPLSGGTLTGSLTFKNSTWNLVGNDAYIGDYDQAGSLGVKGKNGQTNIGFVNQSNNYYIKLASPGVTANRTITMPDDTGTIALTKNIPTIPDKLPASNISMSFSNGVLTITYS